MTRRCRVAVDIGTSGGKILAGWIDDDTLHTEVVHQFEPVRTSDNGREFWDLDHLVDETVAGLEAAERVVGPVESTGVDATAGAIGFVEDGTALGDPFRGGEVSLDRVSRREAFFELGHSRLPSSYYDCYRDDPELVATADWLLPLPGLVATELGGEVCGEVTYAICAGLGNTRTRMWARNLLKRMDLPVDLLPTMVAIGEPIGTVDPPRGSSLESEPTIVVSPGHDTSAAIAAVPFRDDPRAFVATGSWFIPGLELPDPVVTDEAYGIPAENMGGVDGTARFVHNLPGFGLFERCRDVWRSEGSVYEYDALLERARSSPSGPLIEPNAFTVSGGHDEDILAQIETFCRETGQPVPRGEGEITRCLLESLAAKTALLLDRLYGAADVAPPKQLHLVGGGARNPLLRRMLASATDTPILTGPVEATGIGNLLVQFRTGGEIDSIAAGRDLVERSITFDRTDPHDPDRWEAVLDRMRDVEAATRE